MKTPNQVREIAIATALMYQAAPEIFPKTTIDTAAYFAGVAAYLHDRSLLGYEMRQYMAGFGKYLSELPDYECRDFYLETSAVHAKLFTDYVLGQQAAARLAVRRSEPPAYNINTDTFVHPWPSAEKAWPLHKHTEGT
jgi:hypothetical protein